MKSPMHDEWIIGEATASGRWYLIHTTRPAFRCEVFETRDDDEAAVLDGFVYAAGDYELARFVWHDPRPRRSALDRLLADGLVVLASYDAGEGEQGTTGERIRRYRQLAEMTQAELAIEASTSQDHISEIENDHHEPTIELLGRLADAIGVHRGALLGD